MGRPAIPLHIKLLNRLRKTETCWFCDYKSHNQYGHTTIVTKRKTVPAHRVAYEYWIGPIPDGMYVLHTCDTPGCVNPSHLFLGTQADNCQDAVSKGRAGRYGKGDGIIHSVCGNEYRISPKGQKYCPLCCNNSYYRKRGNKLT